MMIMKDISIGYSNTLLSANELVLQKGEAYVLIGRNGSGKTTFLKSILGEVTLLKGDILIDDININDILSRSLSKIIAFVPSTFPGTSFVLAEDYVALGRSPYTNHFGRLTNQDLEIIDDSFRTLEIDHLKNKFTTDLSDGEKQLVGIAKALAQQTPYIFLDEPLAFLDYTNRKMVLSKIKRLTADLNKCILLSSHDIDITMDYNFNYILIDKATRLLRQEGRNCSKAEIIEICF